MSPAPIALFVYRRPEHTRACLDKLKANALADQSDLFVFSDGPRNPEAAEGVSRVRALLQGLTGFRSVTVVARETNLGLAKSIISGVTDIVDRFGQVIVLEDDLVTSPHFLRYMNEALDLYRDREEVAGIHAYIYPVQGNLPDTFFLRGADCWGWATWKRGWALFDPDGKNLLARLRAQGLTHAFDRNGAYPYTRMLEDQIAGRNDSWAVRWYASAFLAEKLTLYPGRSLVKNIGMDALGTHSVATDVFNVNLAPEPVAVAPVPLREEPEVLTLLDKFFRSMQPSLPRRVARKLKGLLRLKPT
jgi:hypothetical protein